MGKLRIFIVDDSAVIRKLLTMILEQEPDLEVAGTAPNGAVALSKIELAKPDLVTLDVEMPVMDGLTTLPELKRRWPRLPVIMFSTLTSRGAEATIEALSRGASDYVTKPEGFQNFQESMGHLRRELVPRIHALCTRFAPQPVAPPPPLKRPETPLTPAKAPLPERKVEVAERHQRLPKQSPRPKPTVKRKMGRYGLAVLGISTGGPNALGELLPTLPGNLPVPLLIVQHMPPMFTKMLADRLNTKCALTIREAEEGAVIKPGEVWIARGDYHMEVHERPEGLVLHLQQEPAVNSCRPAADVLFESAAVLDNTRVLGIVMTGMGHDGRDGAALLRDAGGEILAQDEASSVVWGMPGSVVEANLADSVLPLSEIGQTIVRKLAGLSLSLRGLN